MDTPKISNVLIFKDGYYWLTEKIDLPIGNTIIPFYSIIKDLEYNGFEFASDAYLYIAKLNEGIKDDRTA